MDKKGIANYVMCILQKTFDALDDAYENNLEDQKTNANSHLIFPTYSGKNGNYRVSEQELRFEFIHQFLKSQEENGGNTPKLYYSIETPTKKKYRFSKPKDSSEFNDGYPKEDTTGKSAQFDVVLFNEKAQRVCLIEFKAKNPSQILYVKDLLKLNAEGEDKVCFFVQILMGFDKPTEESIIEKLLEQKSQNEEIRKNLCLNNTIYICHVLKKIPKTRNDRVKIYYIDKQGILELPQDDEQFKPLG